VIVAPDPDAEVVAIQFWMTAGSADEPADASGTAHLTEHLLVRAAHRSSAALVATGASFDGVTTLDHCVLRVVVRPEDAATALRAGAAAFASTRLTEPLEIERSVLGRELIHRGADGARRTAARMTAAFGPDHPYARLVAGDPKRIETLDAGDVERFRRVHHARRLAIVIAGGIDPEDAGIARALGELDRLPGTQATPTDRSPSCARGAVHVDGPESILLALPGVRAASPDAPLLDLFAHTLGTRLEPRTGWARSWTARCAGLLVMSCRADSGAMIEVADELSEEGPSDEELAAAKAVLGTDLSLGLMTANRTATELGWNETTAGGAEQWGLFHRRLRAASSADVARAARSRLRWRDGAIVVAGRERAADRLAETRAELQARS
jgi:predicted Zn-dependent peptidase